MKKLLALILCLTLVFLSGITANAQYDKLTRDEWDMYYASQHNNNNFPTLNVGSDETMFSLCWHSPAEKANAEVRVSKNEDMSNYKTLSSYS